jgi:predicted GNAT family acetyltransferase
MTDLDTSKPLPVRQNSEANRFELEVDGQLAILEYMRAGPNIIYTHTEVPLALEGRGLARQLAHHAMEYARGEGLKVQALCPFVSGYVDRHPEYQDITWGY